MGNKPKKTFRAGACSASVFVNERPGDDGPRQFNTVTFSCRFKDETTGEWRDASSMSPNEVARALLVLQKALEFCLLTESEN